MLIQLYFFIWFEMFLTQLTHGTKETYFWVAFCPKSINVATKVTIVNALLGAPYKVNDIGMCLIRNVRRRLH